MQLSALWRLHLRITASDFFEVKPRWCPMNPERSRRDAIPVAFCCLLSGIGFVSALETVWMSASDDIWVSLPIVAFALTCLITYRIGHPYRALGVFVPATTIHFFALLAIPNFTIGESLVGIMAAGLGATFGALLKFANRRQKRIATRTFSPRVLDVVGWIVFLLCVLWGLGLPLTYKQIPFDVIKNAMYYQGVLFLFIAMLLAWLRLFRPFFECCISIITRVGYRIRGTPSDSISVDGPMIVIANHACWWDPLFVAGALPRPITPMMTSVFYDRWFLRPLMVRVFQAIRVEEAKARREAPELQQAIAALDAGQCVLIFPEAYLRRKEEIPLRRFGRGIWEILKQRPNTPIVACWIEGAWGCHSSYFNGPPAQNKKLDFLRPIEVAVSEPFQLEPDVLEHHLRTRITLMNRVGQVRTKLGLEALPPFELPKADDGGE